MGRIGYFLVGGAAIFAGMVFQGDVDLDSDHWDKGRVVDVRDRDIDRKVDRILDREAARIEIDTDKGQSTATDEATRRALAAAVAELVRAEGSLVAAKIDDNLPEAAILQAEKRRDTAREAVERIADDVRDQTRENRDAMREIRDQARDEARAAVRS